MIAGMRIAIGADHAGFELKEHVVGVLRAGGHDVADLGTHSTESVDYPPICAAVGRAVRDGEAERGIVIGGSGQGEQLAANKVRGVRAALCNDLYTARYGRMHNDANVLSMGGRVVGVGLAEEILDTFLTTEFEGGRHARRVAQLAEIEAAEAERR
jgi:ribose 5-phosphate isomerase B